MHPTTATRLTGFPEAVQAVFYPDGDPQLYRASRASEPRLCSYQDRKRVAIQLRALYRAETIAGAEAALERFAASPEGLRYPTIAPLWRRQWDYVTPAFAYPPASARS